jgi:release factor glutamine methyltransferase
LTIAEILQYYKSTAGSASDTPSLDGQVLLAHILGKPRTWLLAHPKFELSQLQISQFEDALSQIQANIPLPYILGHWEFYGLDFSINPSVLIPRPETELLVEEALSWLRAHPDRRRAADIGTGSGCIAVSLAKHSPNVKLIATDISAKALHVARVNAQKHNVEGFIEFINADLLSPLRGQHVRYDLICANLPYIPTNMLHTLPVYCREPTLALDGGADGLNSIRQLLLDAPKCLEPSGLLLLEIDSSQGVSALALSQEAFPHGSVHLLEDLAGHARLIRIEK